MRALLAAFAPIVALLCSSVTAASERADDGPKVVALAQREVVDGRAAQVIMAQTAIATSVDLGRIASMDNGGGLLGSLIISSMDDRATTMAKAQSDRAEAAVAPLRAVLADFDVAALALAATKAGLAKPAWLKVRDVTIGNGPEERGRATFLAATDTAQVVFVAYRYDLSPDFTQIRVTADIRIELRRTDTASGGSTLAYHQQVLSIAQLGTRSFEPSENVARWSAGNGDLARTALTAAFGRFATLLPLALDLRQADIDSMAAKTREKGFAAGFYGGVVARNAVSANDILLWKNGLIAVQTIP